MLWAANGPRVNLRQQANVAKLLWLMAKKHVSWRRPCVHTGFESAAILYAVPRFHTLIWRHNKSTEWVLLAAPLLVVQRFLEKTWSCVASSRTSFISPGNRSWVSRWSLEGVIRPKTFITIVPATYRDNCNNNNFFSLSLHLVIKPDQHFY